MHSFSMTCKVDVVQDRFCHVEEREKAVTWFRRHRISRVYLESCRHGRVACEDILRTVRDHFQAAGLQVAGCITPTSLSARKSVSWAPEIVTCFSDPVSHERLQSLVEMTAKIFDYIIFDDFFFHICSCPACEQERGNQSLQEYRRDLMLRLAKERIIAPARAVNPRVQLILKFPNWYDRYATNGYAVCAETELFDQVWIGTETREPDSPEAGRRPQTQASWLQGWLNDLAGSKCGGAWYDPIDTRPETFVEQARQSILGGARESLLHCYDYLATTTPGLAVHGKDLELRNGLADAEAFRGEADSLQQLAECLQHATPFGVTVPKAPDFDAPEEKCLGAFWGMLGLPIVAAASLRPAPAVILDRQASGFSGLPDYLRSLPAVGTTLLITVNLLRWLRDRNDCADFLPEPLLTLDVVGDSPLFQRLTDKLGVVNPPADPWEMTVLPVAQLQELRDFFLPAAGVGMQAPSRVALHLYHLEGRRIEVVENFNNAPVEVTLLRREATPVRRTLLQALPDSGSASLNTSGSFRLQPRALVTFQVEAVR